MSDGRERSGWGILEREGTVAYLNGKGVEFGEIRRMTVEFRKVKESGVTIAFMP